MKIGDTVISAFTMSQYDIGAAASITFTQFEVTFLSCFSGEITYSIVNESPSGFLTFPSASCGVDPLCRTIDVDSSVIQTITFQVEVNSQPVC